MKVKVGLLWFDDDPRRPLSEKIEEAAQRYREKFGVDPDTCYVNPATLGDGKVNGTRVRVVPATQILPHHLLLGVAQEN
jgi:hypothetical protein